MTVLQDLLPPPSEVLPPFPPDQRKLINCFFFCFLSALCGTRSSVLFQPSLLHSFRRGLTLSPLSPVVDLLLTRISFCVPFPLTGRLTFAAQHKTLFLRIVAFSCLVRRGPGANLKGLFFSGFPRSNPFRVSSRS